MEISQPLLELDWIPRPRVTALRRLGIEKVEDLLTHYPRRYEDRQEFPGFPHEESETPICLCGEVVNTDEIAKSISPTLIPIGSGTTATTTPVTTGTTTYSARNVRSSRPGRRNKKNGSARVALKPRAITETNIVT